MHWRETGPQAPAGSGRYLLRLRPWYEWAAEPSDMPPTSSASELCSKVDDALNDPAFAPFGPGSPLLADLLPGLLALARHPAQLPMAC